MPGKQKLSGGLGAGGTTLFAFSRHTPPGVRPEAMASGVSLGAWAGGGGIGTGLVILTSTVCALNEGAEQGDAPDTGADGCNEEDYPV